MEVPTRPLPLRKARRLNEELTALLSLTDRALSTLELPELLDSFLARVLEGMEADAGSILLASEGRLAPAASRGFTPGAVPRADMSAADAEDRFSSSAPQL